MPWLPCSALRGWVAATVHSPISDKGHFDQDTWQLYHVDEDRAESNDLAKQHPDKLQALIKAWFEEADKNLVLPIDDRTALEQLNIERPAEEPPRERYIYYPGTAPVPEGVAVNVRGRSYKILADVEIKDASCSGVISADAKVTSLGGDSVAGGWLGNGSAVNGCGSFGCGCEAPDGAGSGAGCASDVAM